MPKYTIGGKEYEYETLVDLTFRKGEVDMTWHRDSDSPEIKKFSLTLDTGGRDNQRVTVWMSREEALTLVAAFQKVRV